MGSQQLYSLSWGEFGSSFASTVQVLRGQNEMMDVTLVAGGRIFTAHKLVLSAASPLLMELLKSTSCQHPVLMLAGITAPDLETLLEFVYQGEVSVDTSQLPSLLQAAHCLDIQALSPQTLTAEKTMTPISVPVVMTESLPDMNSIQLPTRDVHSPLLPVRKRKRKQQNSPDTDGMKWTVAEGVVAPEGGIVLEARPVDHILVQNTVDNHLKEEIMDDQQHCNGEPGSKRLVSDMPVECTVCGVTLRQSRNLRRHMELIHLKVDNGKPRKSQLMKDETKVDDEASIQTLTELEPMEPTRLVEQSVRPTQLVVIPSSQMTQQSLTQQTLTQQTTQLIQSTSQQLTPVSQVPASSSHLLITSPPVYHNSSTHCDPYTHVTHTQTHTHTHLQFTHDNVFRQHQTELLRGAGLYADTREHCVTE